MKVQVFIHANYNEYDKEYHFEPWRSDMTGYAGSLVETQEIEFTPPPRDVLVNGTIAEYREQQKKIRAEAESKINVLEQRINDLLCIEYKPEATEEI